MGAARQAHPARPSAAPVAAPRADAGASSSQSQSQSQSQLSSLSQSRSQAPAQAAALAAAPSLAWRAPAAGAGASLPLLGAVRATVTRAANDELVEVGRSADHCPYIARTLARFEGAPADYVERVAHRYAGRAAAQKDGLLTALDRRVRLGVQRWKRGDASMEAAAGALGAAPDGVPGAIVSPVSLAAATSSAEGVLGALGPGAPLAPGARARMESAFGRNLGGVRVHTDERAARLSTMLSARAFTVGQHVAFAPHEHAPGTVRGDLLLAHELAHTVQQRGATGGGGIDADAPRERDADRVAVGAAARLHPARAQALGMAPPAALPEVSGGLKLSRCDPDKTEQKKQEEAVDAGQKGSADAVDGGSDAVPDVKKAEAPTPLQKIAVAQKVSPGCLTFADTAALQAQKKTWDTAVAKLAKDKPAKLMEWIVGKPDQTEPTIKNAFEESAKQRECLATAVGSASGSKFRSFDDQLCIWLAKFYFMKDKTTLESVCGKGKTGAVAPFGAMRQDTVTECLKTAAKGTTRKFTPGAEWNTSDADHEKCWKALSSDQRQKEILQTSSAPGISRHHWGSDFDFADVTPAHWETDPALLQTYGLLRQFALGFGFIQSFTASRPGYQTGTPGKGYEGYLEERWHWSYYPVAQALLDWVKDPTNKAAVAKQLAAEWKKVKDGTGSYAALVAAVPELKKAPDPFSYIQANWEKFVTNVNQDATPVIKPAAPVGTGGYTKNDNIGVWRIAWTFDDGPTDATPDMVSAVESSNVKGATWFIMRNLLQKPDLQTNLVKLQDLQDRGHEIAIHSMHETANHVCWFPLASPASGTCEAGYTTMAKSMDDLKTFTGILRGAHLRVHFARVTTGLLSELVVYLKEGKDAEKVAKPDDVARKIIKGEAVTGTQETKVKKDFDLFAKTLDALKLHEWGDKSPADKGGEIGAQSWERESSGDPTGTRKDTINEEWIKKQLESIKKRSPKEKFSVFLAHDVTAGKKSPFPDVTEVKADIALIEKLAAAEKIRVEYYRVGDLYRFVWGDDKHPFP